MRRLTIIWALLLGLTFALTGCPKQDSGAETNETATEEGTNDEATAEAKATAEKAGKLIQTGLDWLVTQQNDNGSFGKIPGADKPGEVGITALAIKALAGAPTAIRKKHETVLQEAVDWLLSNQQESGTFTTARAGLDTYRTAIAIMALQETDAEKYASQIKKATDFLKNLQFTGESGLENVDDPEKNPHYGGWGYDETGKKADTDLSNTNFALMALKEAGVSEDSDVWKRTVKFLSRCQQNTETNDLRVIAPDLVVRIGDDGGFIYDPGLTTGKGQPKKLPDGKVEMPSYASMTYAGLMSLLYANVAKDDPRVKAAMNWIRKHYTLDENYGLGSRQNPENAKQGLYYFFHAFARAMQAYGEKTIETADGETHVWTKELVGKLAELQKPDGFWRNEVSRWWERDPVLCTCYVVMALNIVREETT